MRVTDLYSCAEGLKSNVSYENTQDLMITQCLASLGKNTFHVDCSQQPWLAAVVGVLCCQKFKVLLFLS